MCFFAQNFCQALPDPANDDKTVKIFYFFDGKS